MRVPQISLARIFPERW